MLESDLPGLLDTTLNHAWLAVLAAIAVIAIIGMIVAVIRDLGVPTAFLFAAIVIVTAGTWAYGAFNINQEEQNAIIRTWISETYDLDESVVNGNISRELGNSRTEAATFVDDEGRALSLITTVEGKLALIDAGGRELPHADDN